MPDGRVDAETVQENPPVIGPGHTYATVTDQIAAIVLTHPEPQTKIWWAAFAIAFLMLMLFNAAVTYLFYKGVGIWGVNIPVGWGFAIVNFVWWIGIGHAGTLISAILLLLHQDWRNSINRFAEAMTLFAVACAGLFPILHLGRPWLAYWLAPYPNTMNLWPQFRSALVWDVFAVSTYGTVSLLFWFAGLMPDLATLRDRAKTRLGRYTYGILAMGWNGDARHWHNYASMYLLLAGLATPLVVSVHTVVSFDFAISIVPGWHTTIFPPYFVAGAIFSGFAMVLALAIPIRALYGLEDFITIRHIDAMAKVMLGTGLIVAFGYAMEVFNGWYSGETYERYMTFNRFAGPYAPVSWAVLMCNVAAAQALWIRSVRRNVPAIFVLSLVIQLGMWLERYMIVISSLHRDFVPRSWGMYQGTIWDYATYIGTIGLFLTLFFLFIRVLPMISIFEMREIVHKTQAGGGH